MDITYEQFALPQHYQDCIKQDAQQIDYLLAVLFHRKKAFSANDVESDARIIRRLNPEKKMLLYWFYLGCIQWFGDLYPRVFSGGGKATGNIYEAQLRIIDSLAGSDMTKKPAVRKGLLLDALVSMEETIRRQEEAEEHNHKK
ncbi:hypothetical protein [Bacteroides intestinalis]|uniref:hypothetical protein n=1 Tax=Bacteroides intestinalis TaxID=329854 RepID=UPI00189EBAB2|nr:hypothetical protein [Bacteroides intestinalis]